MTLPFTPPSWESHRIRIVHHRSRKRFPVWKLVGAPYDSRLLIARFGWKIFHEGFSLFKKKKKKKSPSIPANHTINSMKNFCDSAFIDSDKSDCRNARDHKEFVNSRRTEGGGIMQWQRMSLEELSERGDRISAAVAERGTWLFRAENSRAIKPFFPFPKRS